jgi:preprotein translocase subunit SecG
MEKKDDFIKIIVIVSIVVISVTVVGIILKVKGKSLGFGKSGKNKKSETGTI